MTDGPEVLTPAYYERLEALEKSHWWCRSVRRVGLDLVGPLLSPGALVLDVGCGAGGFLAALDARAPSTRGIGTDLSLDALARARRQGVRLLAVAIAAALPAPSDRFDLVVANDVLQHLPDGEDERCLAEVFRVLKPGGFLCLRANFGDPVAQGSALHRRYDRGSLSRLARGSGFEIAKHIVLHPLARLWSAIGGRRGRGHEREPRGLTVVLPPAPVNAALDLYSRLEDALLERLPWTPALGDAQILLARKPGRYTAPAANG